MFLNIDEKFKKFLNILYSLAKRNDNRIFIVGGAVRDCCLNIPVKDFDLILEGNAIEFSSRLPSEISVKSVHKDFGTVKLMYNDIIYDLASTRLEKYPYSGCLPVIEKIGVAIEDDVLRRDFTINSMYFEIKDDLNFEIIDLVHGIEDLKSKQLKVLHDNSYIDDPTRILRGMGFKYRFGFDFSQYDKKLIKTYLNKIDYSNMSQDRLISVLFKTLAYPFGFEIFKEIHDNGFLKIISPNIKEIDFNLLYKIKTDFVLSNSDFSNLCLKIVLDNEIVKNTVHGLADVFKTYSKVDIDELAYNFYITKNADILEYLKLKDIKLNVSGDDLIRLGFKQGKQIGEILDSLLEYKLNYKLNNPDITLNFEDEIKFIKSFPIK